MQQPSLRALQQPLRLRQSPLLHLLGPLRFIRSSLQLHREVLLFPGLVSLPPGLLSQRGLRRLFRLSRSQPSLLLVLTVVQLDPVSPLVCLALS